MVTHRRHLPPPPLACASRTSLDPENTPVIDAALKQLKACSRRLQAALASHRTELQVLERLYYKGKNQHRTALFWQRVAEMRKLGGRVDEMHMDDTVESLRLAFWGDPLSRTPKLLKGSWTHCPDAKALLFAMERCSACCTLVDRARERLLRAYESFTLMMQTGAFLQLVLVLAAIASRLSILLSEVKAALEVSWSASHRVLQALFPAEARKVQQLVKPASASPPSARSASLSRPRSPPGVPGPGDAPDEDLGSALARAPPQERAPEENTAGAFDADATATEQQRSDPASMTYSLLNELAQPIGTPPMLPPSPPAGLTSFLFEGRAPPEAAGSAPQSAPVQLAANGPKRKKSDDPKGKPVKKKKKKRDEIDDIFGF